ncbi:hypothetical protein evm_003775 [Chilo suppressalis]|nr:hypothetical protein evm_003775 [Chilo suppressalis]
MRHISCEKVFFCGCFFAIVFIIFNLSVKSKGKTEYLREDQLKFILEWTSPMKEPFLFLGIGQEGFKRRRCNYTNCYITSDRFLLRDMREFDVVLFHGPEINRKRSKLLDIRSPRQKFVYASKESSHYYPICSNKLENYFNWTWTYRLDSDARWGYILVKDRNGTVIGPNKIMHWLKLEEMEPVDLMFKEKLKSKKKAAAWFVSNCKDLSGRKKFGEALKRQLKKYNLDLDIYGACGSMSCSRDEEKECDSEIDEIYYFYLAFENSFSEDYVTEKLLHALKNNAVPVVYGGANYSRFMPEGIYLNARDLGVKKLAAKMNELIQDPDKYAEYFRWKNHYSFHSRDEYDSAHNEYCEFCALLNDEARMSEVTTISKFKEWWNKPDFC